MSLCACCGLELPGDSGLCSHHHTVYGDDWARGNKIFCDWVHRKIEPPKVDPSPEIPLGEEDQVMYMAEYTAQIPWWARYVDWQEWYVEA